MASSLSAFYLCSNPLAVYTKGMLGYIYHNMRPRFVAALFRIDADNFIDMSYEGLNIALRYIRGDKENQVYLIVIDDIIDRSTTTKLSQILHQAASWYITCLNMDDQKTYGKSSWVMLSQYNTFMPDIQVLEVKRAGSFVLFYPGGVKTFKQHRELDLFLKKALNYPDPTIEVDLMINVFEREPRQSK